MFKLPEIYALTRNERFVYNLCANPKALWYTKVEIIGSLIHSLRLHIIVIIIIIRFNINLKGETHVTIKRHMGRYQHVANEQHVIEGGLDIKPQKEKQVVLADKKKVVILLAASK